MIASVKPRPLTVAIERKIADSGDAGITIDAIMSDMRIGRTCARNHLNLLECLGAIRREKVKKQKGGGFDSAYHPNENADPLTSLDLKQGAMPRRPVVQNWESVKRRDYLVAALFGPAP